MAPRIERKLAAILAADVRSGHFDSKQTRRPAMRVTATAG
jgi:hypothetical protein